jgi:hypothetical protein
MSHPRDRWANAWSHAEDSLLWEAIEHTGQRHRQAYKWFQKHGGNRAYHAFKNRGRLLLIKSGQIVIKPKSFTSPVKGWGFV